jgi:hypothetical protein
MPSGTWAAAKEKKTRARQQPDLAGREAHFAREIRRDNADGIAQELADEVDRRERTDERDDAA